MPSVSHFEMPSSLCDTFLYLTMCSGLQTRALLLLKNAVTKATSLSEKVRLKAKSGRERERERVELRERECSGSSHKGGRPAKWKQKFDPARLIELFFSGQSPSLWVAGLVNPFEQPDLLSAPRSVFMIRGL